MRVRWIGILSLLLLAGCGAREEAGVPAAMESAATEPAALEPAATEPAAMEPAALPALDVFGPAPELRNDTWLNTDGAVLRLADLEGKVVLLEFWTFGCVNCQRVIPHLRTWHDAYAGDDFALISVHYPEFSHERDIDNVRAALERLEIQYPVAIDNDRLTWGAYNQRYWPTLYLIDRTGNIRYQHIGEGAYAETEAAILALIAEPG